MANIGERLVSDAYLSYNTLNFVFKYLDIKDLIRCAQVCPLWKWVVSDDPRWRNLQICCCENDLKQINTAVGGYMQDVVIKLNRSNPSKVFKEFVTENHLLNVTLVDCRMEHLYLLSRHQSKNLEELHAILVEKDPHPVVIKQIKAFAHVTMLEVNDPGPVTDLKFLECQPQLRHLTLTSRYGSKTWKELLRLGELESLTIYGDLEHNEHPWIQILFEEGWILWLSTLKKLKLIWYYKKFYICKYPFILEKFPRMPNLQDLTLRGVSFRSGTEKPLDYYLRKCYRLEKIEVQFGEVEHIWNPRIAVSPIHKESAEDNVKTILGFLSLGNIKLIHWILMPLVTGIALFEPFVIYLYRLGERTGRIVFVPTNPILRPDHVVFMPIPLMSFILQCIKPNTQIIIEDAISYRKRKTEKRCIVCDKVVFSRQLLNQLG